MRLVNTALGRFWRATCLGASLSVTASAFAQSSSDLKGVSLEDLMSVEVTSASRREQKLSDVASAVFVITREDIRRSGATSVAEVLRLAPGLEVAHIDANKWAISSRGFNGRFADKMLVLIDGRSVYTPLFSGVYWDVQDVVLGDVERIEVIRGPGATVWGANAVNGVVNIITRSAADTQGPQISLRIGGEDRTIAEMRYGWKSGANGSYRAFTKYVNRSPFADAAGRTASDGWNEWRGGARADLRLTPDDSLVVDAQLYSGTAGQTYAPGSPLPFFQGRVDSVAELSGGNILGRWRRNLTSTADLALQVYHDRTSRADFLLGERRATTDVDFQLHTKVGQVHDVVWGAGYRVTSDDIRNGPIVSFETPEGRDRLFNAFAQDEIAAFGRVRLTLGSKIEHSNYSGWEFQPNARVLFPLTSRQSLWAAVSRAVRTPSRAEHYVRINSAPTPDPATGLPAMFSLRGAQSFESEVLRAHEVGYRAQTAGSLSFDAALFVNVYDRLRTFEPGAPAVTVTASGPLIVVPVLFGNGMTGRTSGGEISTSWTPTERWRLAGTYAYLRVKLTRRPDSLDTIGQIIEDDSPRHQFRVNSHLQVSRAVEVNASLQWVDRLIKQQIPSYSRLDASVVWHVTRFLSVAAGGANLLDSRHPEFGSTLGELPTEARRSAYVTLAWRH